MATIPKLSVVIPVYNEELVLPTLFARLYPALDALQISYECIFVNDGSKDRSVALLRLQFARRPKHTRVVIFHANFGQHSAIMAGFNYARGEYVVTLDADLQNPPEEIGKLVEKLDQGFDYVGTIRQQRQDTLWRRVFSRAINKLRERIMPVRITEMSVNEESFDPHLNPIRAKVSLGLRVLSVDDFPWDHRGTALYLAYQQQKEALARRAASLPLTTLGISNLS